MASGTVGLMSFLSTRCTSRLKFIKSSSSILVIFTLFITWILRGSPTVTIWTLIVNYYYDLKSCSRLLNLRSQMKPSDSHRNPHWSLVAFFTSLRCAEIRAGIMLWNDISQCETTPRSAWKKKNCQRKCKVNIQVSVFLPGSPRGLISDHTEEEGELCPIMVSNFWFSVKTYLKFEQRCHSCGVPISPWGLSQEASRHAAPTHQAPFIPLPDTLSVMLQRGSILIVWTDHSRERGFDFGCWQNRHRLARCALASVLP